MSARRRLLSWLWTAIWLRWRLVRLETARLLRRDARAVNGPDLYLQPADIPVEGFDYETGRLPPSLLARLDATRAELLDTARRRAVPAQARNACRRRVASLATVGLLVAGAAGAGAATLVTGTTGVPAVDRLLGTYEGESDPDGAGRALQPQPSGDSITVHVRVGTRRLLSTSYVARDGRLCSVLTDVEGATGDVACVTRATLMTQLARERGMLVGLEDQGDRVVLRGFVTDRVRNLSGRGSNGPLEVRLGGAWTPPLSGVEPLRPFVATGRSAGDGLINPRDYILRAVDDDGYSTEITP